MLDKFQKLFGPNSEPCSSDRLGSDYAGASLAGASKKTGPGAFRRRVFGFIAFVLFLCAVLPWVFEPAEQYAVPGAQTRIGTPSKLPYAQRMSIVPKSSDKEKNAKKAEEVARNLSQANPPAVGKAKPLSSASESSVLAKETSVRRETDKKGAAHLSFAKKKDATTQTSATKGKSLASKDKNAGTTTKRYYIQIVATSNKASAVERASRIRKLGLPVYIEKTRRHKSDLWRVRVGRFDSIEKARTALDKLALNSVTNGGIMTEKPAKKP